MFLERWLCHIANMKLKCSIFFGWMPYHFLGHVSQWQAIYMFIYQCFNGTAVEKYTVVQLGVYLFFTLSILFSNC